MGKETIIARWVKGLLIPNGSAETHKVVLQIWISFQKLFWRKVWTVTFFFEILSIDIAHVDIGKNIGAKLQTDQA